jgi:DnaJ-class molecular chaperone
MSPLSYYQVLGVPRNASSIEIRAAFVRLVKHHHPDHAPNTRKLPGRLREVQLAYRCLSDSSARVAHDKALEEIERLHFVRQRRVRNRLQRYDGRHPYPQPNPADSQGRARIKVRWRFVLVAIVSVIILARLV